MGSMRRFIFLTFLGEIATLAGHGIVSLGLHPYRLDSLAPLLQGCAVLVFGTAMFGSGSRGLREINERFWRGYCGTGMGLGWR